MNNMYDAEEQTALKGEEPSTALQSMLPLDAESPTHALSVSTLVEQCRRGIQAFRRGEPSDEASGLELLDRAIRKGDQDAWAGLQQCLAEIVQCWLYAHPCRERTMHWESDENYVALTFERFWQATTQQQIRFRAFAAALVYLRVSLNGVLLDTLRAYMGAREVTLPEAGAPGEPPWEDQPDSTELWELLQRVLQSERERRLAYLLYHCNLKPREIVRFCQEEWPEVQEVYRLRRNIQERVLRRADQLRWHLQVHEQEERERAR